MSEIKLKPCPFCGSKEVYVFSGFYRIVCTNCKAKFQTDKYMTDEQLSEAWNKRTEPLAHWIYINDGSHHRWSYRCSNCSRLSGHPSEYCPFCGFNMNEEWRK